MKRKTKILISALSVMFVAAIAVAIASFSFAGNGDEDGLLENGEIIADASQNVDTKTIIDYIIDNSNSEDPEVDKIYHIAEISSSSASSLETFVSSNGFKDYVIDGKTGYLCSPLNADEFADKIKLLSDVNLRRSMKNACIDKAEEFRMYISHKQMSEIYEQLLAKKS